MARRCVSCPVPLARKFLTVQSAVLVTLPLGVSLAGCGDTSGSGPVAAVEVTPAVATLELVGETAQLDATARDASGKAVSGKAFTWSSSDEAAVTVSPSGEVSAVARGSATITATTDGIDGTATVEVIVRFEQIGAGRAHACGTTARGTTFCWGDNSVGQLGDGSDTATMRPVPVAGGRRFVQLTAGGRDHTCGLTAEGHAYCWGQNGVGQLGDGTTTSRNEPVRAAAGLSFTTVEAGVYHTCGLTAGGQAYCWGSNGAVGVDGYGFGAPTTEVCANPEAPYRGDTWPCSPTPVAVSGGIAFRSISSGLWATCGIAVGGEAYCWGWNLYYQLGDGTDTSRTAPTLVAGDLVFDNLALGVTHACGLVGGEASCWGGEHFIWGQLGTGALEASSTPVPVAGGLSFAAVAPSAGNNIYTFTCGVTAEGASYCWGADTRGQLGTDVVVDFCVGGGETFPCNNIPVTVLGGIDFVALATGEEFACGVDRNGAAFCWGRNDFGQLGDGGMTDRDVPTPVVPLP